MNKYKLNRRIAAFTMASTIFAVGLTGCSKQKESLLTGTVLEDSRVITFEDGHVDIAIRDKRCMDDDEVPHYRSIITNELFGSKSCKNVLTYHYDISSDESIVSYLTEEDLTKAIKKELTDEDIANIIKRIVSND